MYQRFNAGGPMPAQQPQDQGLDVEGQIRAGVEAFMQSQDPAIAVEVVNMLGQMMGIAPEIDPYANQQQAPIQQDQPQQAQPDAGQIPMARNGMRIYRRGGKIPSYATGGETDPKDKSKKSPAETSTSSPELSLSSGPSYLKLNPKSSKEQNDIKTKANLAEALRFKNAIQPRGIPVIGGDDINSGGINIAERDTDGSHLIPVLPDAILRADSVIEASRSALYPKLKKRR